MKLLNDISFTVEEGAIFAFLGSNGAGKSTTVKTDFSRLNRSSNDANALWS